MARTEPLLEIINGPPKFELMLSLFDNDNNQKRRYVKFTVKQYQGYPLPNWWDNLDGEVVLEVHVIGMLREDGSGEKWIFHGYLHKASDNGWLKLNMEGQRIEGFYDMRTRTGTMTPK